MPKVMQLAGGSELMGAQISFGHSFLTCQRRRYSGSGRRLESTQASASVGSLGLGSSPRLAPSSLLNITSTFIPALSLKWMCPASACWMTPPSVSQACPEQPFPSGSESSPPDLALCCWHTRNLGTLLSLVSLSFILLVYCQLCCYSALVGSPLLSSPLPCDAKVPTPTPQGFPSSTQQPLALTCLTAALLTNSRWSLTITFP